MTLGGIVRALGRVLGRPARDFVTGLDGALDRGGLGLLAVVLGLAVGWWVYVPLHELGHAGACLLSGGTVETLEVAPIYGGGLLAELFPFVVAGGDYAGRLSGFDTRGCDGIYLATVFGPYLLTLFPGVWALIACGRWARRRLLGGVGFGLAMPFALAPFLSITGDAYEIGSILVTRLAPWTTDNALLRGDDLFKVIQGLSEAGVGASVWTGLTLATLVGAAWAWLTYGAGAWLADRLLPRQTTGQTTQISNSTP